MEHYEFDVVLLHLGTNDVTVWDNAEVIASDLIEVIETLREKNPAVTVFIARIVPIGEEIRAANIILPRREELNELISSFPATLTNKHSEVILVRQDETIKDLKTEFHDALHPSALGDQLMADTWFTALENWRLRGRRSEL